ncbi:MAG: decarboxylase [Firmicutes bacterium]|nr:decarboxylase [Bacillota bacterium]
MFTTISNELYIMGHPLTYWEGHFGLPLHLIFAPKIRENLKAFKKVFKKKYPNSQVKFAAKANPHHHILKIMKEEGIGIDAASAFETRCALDTGILPADIDLNGNCKEDNLIRDAIRQGMMIVADSFEEFELVAALGTSVGITPKIILRISGYELGDVTAASIFTAGLWTKFGAPVEDVPEFIKGLERYPNVDFCGFHTHIGSQITDSAPYLAVLGKMIEMGRLLEDTGKECRVINIGGGFPVSYIGKDTWKDFTSRVRNGLQLSQEGKPMDVYSWGNHPGGFEVDTKGKVSGSEWKGEKYYSALPKHKMLEAILDGNVRVNGTQMPVIVALEKIGTPTLVIEPGRSVVEDAGVTLCKVAHTRTIAKYHNLITVEMGVTSNCSSMIDPDIRNWEIVDDYNDKDEEPYEAFIGGNLCFSGDMIERYKIKLQRKPKRGEVLVAHDTGAYTSSFMAANANATPRPARILVNENYEPLILKKRDTYEDVFSLGDNFSAIL